MFTDRKVGQNNTQQTAAFGCFSSLLYPWRLAGFHPWQAESTKNRTCKLLRYFLSQTVNVATPADPRGEKVVIFADFGRWKTFRKSAGEIFLSGLRGLNIFRSRFGSFFGSFFTLFKPFFVSNLKCFGGNFVLQTCRPNRRPRRQPNRNWEAFPRKVAKMITIASDFRRKIARLSGGGGKDTFGAQRSLRFFLKGEGRGTRNGYEASKGSKGISGL